MITLKTKPTDKILELGGGKFPRFRPNCDVRQVQDDVGNYTVDFTADFNKPLPIQSDEWDGVFTQYCIEHLSWRSVKQFINEIYRILKPGGKAVIVTANTEAQMKWVQEHPEGWDGKDAFDSMSCVLFGDQDYPENTHKNFMSPLVVFPLLQGAGFVDIKITPYGERATDMVIEAVKPAHNGILSVSQPVLREDGTLTIHTKPLAMNGLEVKEGQTLGQLINDSIERGDSKVFTSDQKPPKVEGEVKMIVNGLENQLQKVEQENKAIETIISPLGKMIDKLIAKGDGETLRSMLSGNTPKIPREQLFDKEYFNGGKKVGGYANEGYRDFACHEITARHVLARKPESVLEIGSARGYILKRIQDAGIKAYGLEISKHCWLSRVADGITNWDICKTPWPISEPIDMCFSIAVMEHIPEEFLPAVVKEMEKHCKRGLHGIDFGHKDDGFDKTHCFPAGTLVTMANGQKIGIENVLVGDCVIGVCGEFPTHSFVKRTYRHRVDELVSIELDSGGCLEASPEHPVMCNGRWTRIEDVEIGDVFYEYEKEIQVDEDAGQFCKKELLENRLQGNGEHSSCSLGLVAASCCNETGIEKGEVGESVLDGRGIGITQEELLQHNEEGIVEDASKEEMEWDYAYGSEDGFETFSLDRVSEAIKTTSAKAVRGGVCCGGSRWGRVDISFEGREQTDQFEGVAIRNEREACSEENKALFSEWDYGLQYRSKDGRFCAKTLWGCDNRKSKLSCSEQEVENEFPFVCSEYSGIQSLASPSINYSIFNNQKKCCESCGKVSTSSVGEGKECLDWKGGMGFIRRMAKVVSKKRLSRMGVEVFNLETSTENYVANDVLVHNCTLRDKNFWVNILPKGHEVVDKEELERGVFPEDVAKGDGKVKLNIGSFITMHHHGWHNLDIHNLVDFANANGYLFKQCDVRQGLPYQTGEVSLIHACHFLEHLTYKEALIFLRECRRVIKPDGAMRIIVPDARELVGMYSDGFEMREKPLSEFDEINDGSAECQTSAGKLWNLLFSGHSAMYDWETLDKVLKESGWQGINSGFRRSSDHLGSKQILRETIDMMPEFSIFCEALPIRG